VRKILHEAQSERHITRQASINAQRNSFETARSWPERSSAPLPQSKCFLAVLRTNNEQVSDFNALFS